MTGLFLTFLLAAVYLETALLMIVPFGALLFYWAWQNPFILFFVLLISLPLSFEFNFTETLASDIPDEALMLLVSAVFVCICIYDPRVTSKYAWRHPLLFLFFLQMGWALLICVFSTDPLLSFKYFLAKTWYAGAFVIAAFVVFANKKRIIISAFCLAVPMLIVAVIALLRHYQFDYSFVSINQSVAPFFRNHVNYSAMMVCILPIFFAGYILSSNSNFRKAFLVAIALLLIALFFSYARGAWLALAMGATAWWLIRKRLLVLGYLVAILVSVGIVTWLQHKQQYLSYSHDYRTTIFHEDFTQHLIATYKFKDVSTAERFYRWVAGARMIRDEPFVGFGPNTFYDQYKPYAIPAFKTWVSNNPEHSTVHNYFLLMIIEQGIPGLVLFLVLLGLMLYYAQHLYHRNTDRFYKIAALTVGAIICMIATVNLLSDLIETDKIGSIFYLCMSLLIMIDVNTRKLSKFSPDV